jgi:hypothetical protein
MVLADVLHLAHPNGLFCHRPQLPVQSTWANGVCPRPAMSIGAKHANLWSLGMIGSNCNHLSSLQLFWNHIWLFVMQCGNLAAFCWHIRCIHAAARKWYVFRREGLWPIDIAVGSSGRRKQESSTASFPRKMASLSVAWSIVKLNFMQPLFLQHVEPVELFVTRCHPRALLRLLRLLLLLYGIMKCERLVQPTRARPRTRQRTPFCDGVPNNLSASTAKNHISSCGPRLTEIGFVLAISLSTSRRVTRRTRVQAKRVTCFTGFDLNEHGSYLHRRDGALEQRCNERP